MVCVVVCFVLYIESKLLTSVRDWDMHVFVGGGDEIIILPTTKINKNREEIILLKNEKYPEIVLSLNTTSCSPLSVTASSNSKSSRVKMAYQNFLPQA